jgi:selenocysteine lyase/cysteine desulfurase
MLIADLRAREFARLDATDHAYLDYTGAALYPMSLVEAHAAMLRNSVLGNPHSENGASLASSALLCEARGMVRRFFHAEDYEVCFTANASGAIRLVAESFPFRPGSTLLLASDNHNSINGMREYARRGRSTVRYLPLDDELHIDARDLGAGPGLFAYPAQSNFSGAKHPTSLIERAHSAGYSVMLDAAAFAPTNTLDLRAVSPDFVAVSLYKMFGYPTGVGALLVRRDALDALRRPWFAGGTVEQATVQGMTHRLRAGAEGFEDGTVNYLALGAVSAGLRWLAEVGVERVGTHASLLAARLVAGLRALRHRSGEPMARLYGPSSPAERGAIVTFNVIDERQAAVPYADVEALARDVRVSVRGGCFCNPGAAEGAGLGLGAPVEGAVRASLGVASDARDVDRLLEVVASAATRRPVMWHRRDPASPRYAFGRAIATASDS